MLEILVILYLIVQNIPACPTCGLGWLAKPFSASGGVTSVSGDTMTVATNESAWTIRDVIGIGLLITALIMAVYEERT